MNKILAAGTTALTAAGALAAVALLTAPGPAAADTVTATRAVTATHAPTASTSSSICYTQAGKTVTMYRGGAAIGTLRVTSATYADHNGQLELSVSAEEKFSFTSGEFIWEDTSGADTLPVDPNQKFTVEAGQPRTVVVDYRKVGRGAIVWAPGSDDVAGIWKVKGSGKVTGPGSAGRSVCYTQADRTVTVYRHGDAVATLALASATWNSATGKLKIEATATEKFSFVAGAFLWEDPDGADHLPAHRHRVVTVAAGEHRSVVLKYRHVGKGDVAWVPAGTEAAAGDWSIPLG